MTNIIKLYSSRMKSWDFILAKSAERTSVREHFEQGRKPNSSFGIALPFKILLVTLIPLMVTIPSAMETIELSKESSESSLNSFYLETTQGSFEFRQIDYFNLDQPAYEKEFNDYIPHTNDFETIRSMFGLGIACIFKPLLFCKPTLAYELMVEGRKKLKDKYEYHANWDWFIYKSTKFVGHISLYPQTISIPPDMLASTNMESRDILNLGLAIKEEFREKKLTTELAPKFFDKIQFEPSFVNRAIMVYTKPENIPVHKLCQNPDVGFNFLGRAIVPFDYGIMEVDTEFDFFILYF